MEYMTKHMLSFFFFEHNDLAVDLLHRAHNIDTTQLQAYVIIYIQISQCIQFLIKATMFADAEFGPFHVIKNQTMSTLETCSSAYTVS